MSTLAEAVARAAASQVFGLDEAIARKAQPVNALNTSGFSPLDLRVLVLPDPAEQITSGGIIIPAQSAEKDQFAMQFGTLVAVGENAWEEAASRSAAFDKPKAGDRIVFSRYGGTIIKGKDGKDYRLMNDEDVIGRVMEG